MLNDFEADYTDLYFENRSLKRDLINFGRDNQALLGVIKNLAEQL